MAQSTGREDITRLMQARRAMGAEARRTRGGDAWHEVASAAVQRLGRTHTGEFSPARFVTAYGKLSPNGRNALFSSTAEGQGGLREALDDIMALSTRFQETMARYANPSGTGRAVTTVAGLTGITMGLPMASPAGSRKRQMAASDGCPKLRRTGLPRPRRGAT